VVGELQRAFLNQAVMAWGQSSLDSVLPSSWATAQNQRLVDAEAAHANAAHSDHPDCTASTDQ